MKRHSAPRHYYALGIVLGAAGLLSACGQYGNLYLPETQPPPQQPSPPTEKAQDKDRQQTED
jgi:predicted small lipoprotein YifL